MRLKLQPKIAQTCCVFRISVESDWCPHLRLWRELHLRTLPGCSSGSAVNRSIDAWLSSDYTPERWRLNSQRKALWGEVRVGVRLGLGLTLSLTTSWHAAGCRAVRGIGGSRAGKAAGSRAEFRPPHLPLPYAAQVFQIKLLFASFPWWGGLSVRFPFAQKRQIADRFGLIREIFNPPAHATRVSIFNNQTFNTSESGTKGGSLWADYGTQMRSPLSTAPSKSRAVQIPTHTHRRCHWIIKTLTPVNSRARGRD